MEYTFSPMTDFAKLEKAIQELYGPAAAPAQVQRYRRLFQGLPGNAKAPPYQYPVKARSKLTPPMALC